MDIHILSSSSDSEGSPLRALGHFKKSRTTSESVMSEIGHVKAVVDAIKDRLEEVPTTSRRSTSSQNLTMPFKQLFLCAVCKESTLQRDPVIPQCCSGIIVCKLCLQEWLEQSSTCPQCRENISLDISLSLPLYRPLWAMMDSEGN